MRQFLSTNEILCDHGDPDTAAPHTHTLLVCARGKPKTMKNLAKKGLHSSSLQMFWCRFTFTLNCHLGKTHSHRFWCR